MDPDKLFEERAFLAVVHVKDAAQALRNVAIARDEGAHGVFLINHRITADDLLDVYAQARAAHPSWWIGLNLLDCEPDEAFRRVPEDASGLWVDRCGVDLRSEDPAREARAISFVRELRHWRGLHFGGVAFKHQPKSGDPAREALMAAPFMHVVTTSGERTGSPPDLGKIRAMREAIDTKPLAVASGITPENVASYLQLVDIYLVATGVSVDFANLDPRRVRLLADAIRAH